MKSKKEKDLQPCPQSPEKASWEALNEAMKPKESATERRLRQFLDALK
jgi:hypothetical protein